MEHFVEFEDVCKYYQTGSVKIAAADHLNFYVDKGEFCIIVGPSGAGKTTLLNILGGMDSCDEGNVWLDGQNVSHFTARELTTYRRYDVGFVFQFYNLVQNLTALENVELASEICENPLDASETLAHVGLSERMDNFPAQLSGGMRQRAALLRTYLCSEGAALLDEPFSALDALTKASIHRWYLEVMEQIELSTLFITHDIDEAILLSDRIYLLSGKPGHITAELNLHKESRPKGDFALTSQFLEYKKEILSLLQL